ncbi:FAD-dependent monooxygenase [Nocardiopsis sp. RSe5-2]|uniref:FAD-dependent monooxygenase n=1 Tax=Nocardiopsis endophytica TaxID=3018445 RepID=A0ABT4TXD8_9ACTN|nr:FAD-dependent monooxygenase [Nocardiopsis endophytica]MDA2809091.1 FAD-dependent monooxygenase [Nocardiopsis endophytica]
MDAPVVIVGAGPVGLMLAGELRLGGAGVRVLERLAEPSGESRASTLNARTMEIFDQRGLVERLGGPPPNDMRGHFGGIPLDLSGTPTPYPGQWKLPQPRTEELLGEWASGLGAEVRRGVRVRALRPGPDHVEVEADGPGGPTTVRASYVVGCDGEESTVRRLGGFAFPGRDARRELLRADVAGVDVPDRRFERHPEGLAIAARRPDGATRVMVHAFGRRARERTAAPGFDEVVEVWKRVVGEDLSGGTPLWVNAFGDTARQAERYRAGRVLLAGDAAHRQMPVGGLAVNLGLQDAVNLGWKLAAVATGRAPEELLDTYHEERHAAGRRTLAAIGAQTEVLLGGPETGALRTVLAELVGMPRVRGRLAASAGGLDVRYGTGSDGPPPLGAHIPPGALGGAGAAALRAGRGVLLHPDGAAGPVVHDRVETVRGSVDGAPVLVRPDGHAAYVGGDADGLGAAARRWFGGPV